MKYILDTRYRLRGWHSAPTGIYDTRRHEAHFVAQQFYKLLMKCDAAQNNECRKCEYIDRCAGSCRNSALLHGDNYYGVDPDACYFFQNGWEERIRAVAQPAFDAYIKRNPPKEGRNGEEPGLPECL